MKVLYIKDFSPTPGVRTPEEGPFSGEEYRNKILEPEFNIAIKGGFKLKIDLNGTFGYATSFLEEVFGGLVRTFGYDTVINNLIIDSSQRPFYLDDIKEYMNDAASKKNI